MKAILLALVLLGGTVVLAAEPAAACPLHAVCDILQATKCSLQEPTDTYRAMSYCFGWIPLA